MRKQNGAFRTVYMTEQYECKMKCRIHFWDQAMCKLNQYRSYSHCLRRPDEQESQCYVVGPGRSARSCNSPGSSNYSFVMTIELIWLVHKITVLIDKLFKISISQKYENDYFNDFKKLYVATFKIRKLKRYNWPPISNKSAYEFHELMCTQPSKHFKRPPIKFNHIVGLRIIGSWKILQVSQVSLDFDLGTFDLDRTYRE